MPLNCLLGTQLHHTTAYHPKSNGMVERFHCTLKAALMSCCNSSTWYSQLPLVHLGLQTTPKESLDLSAAEMVYGDRLMIPGEFPTTSDSGPSSENLPLTTHPISQTTRPLSPRIYILQHVFIRTDAIRTPLTQPYMGPYRVIIHKQKAFLIDICGTIDWVAIDHLKPAYLPSDICAP
ncbi:uncharacterized protein [Macrobrachium rosenbergii]|uniref:uncharacterized protein n=1 Tax=Macrobrachium rosenbergii TaxID=79674 RepID=UPI0034D583A3